MKNLIRNTLLAAIAITAVGFGTQAEAQLLRRGNFQGGQRNGVIRQGVRSIVQQNGAAIVHQALNRIPMPGQTPQPVPMPYPYPYPSPSPQPGPLPGPVLPGPPANPIHQIIGGGIEKIGEWGKKQTFPYYPGPKLPGPSIPKLPGPPLLNPFPITNPIPGFNPIGTGQRIQQSVEKGTNKILRGFLGGR